MNSVATRYKVKPKGRASLSNQNRTAILWVSLNKEETKGVKLHSTMAWLNERYDKVYIDLADTLDRYNRRGLYELETTQAEIDAREAGTAWCKEQSGLIANMSHFEGILTFDFWRNHEAFDATIKQLFKVAAENEVFKAAIEADIDSYVNRRHCVNMSDKLRQELRASGLNYILEETGANIFAARLFHADRYYPGPQLNSIALLRQGHIEGAPIGLEMEQYIEFNLERRKTQQDLPHDVPVLSDPVPAPILYQPQSKTAAAIAAMGGFVRRKVGGGAGTVSREARNPYDNLALA